MKRVILKYGATVVKAVITDPTVWRVIFRKAAKNRSILKDGEPVELPCFDDGDDG
jgi:hypothetical protein